MAVKMVRQAYPVAVEMPSGPVPPGTPISLPKDRADSLAARFGIVIDKPQQPGKSTALTDLVEQDPE